MALSHSVGTAYSPSSSPVTPGLPPVFTSLLPGASYQHNLHQSASSLHLNL